MLSFVGTVPAALGQVTKARGRQFYASPLTNVVCLYIDKNIPGSPCCRISACGCAVRQSCHELVWRGTQVWVITGDKQETAINIAISCKLINHPDTLHICNAHSPESAHSRLRELLTAVRQHQNPTIFRSEHAAAPTTAELVASAMPLPEGPSELPALTAMPLALSSKNMGMGLVKNRACHFNLWPCLYASGLTSASQHAHVKGHGCPAWVLFLHI